MNINFDQRKDHPVGSTTAISLTVNIVVMAPKDDVLCVLLIKRGSPPFEGAWALPGGYVDEGETCVQAAFRELEEETGISVRPLIFGCVSDDPDRDPRGRVVSVAYRALLSKAPEVVAGDDAVDFQWAPVDDVVTRRVQVAFDHRRIVTNASSALQSSGVR